MRKCTLSESCIWGYAVQKKNKQPSNWLIINKTYITQLKLNRKSVENLKASLVFFFLFEPRSMEKTHTISEIDLKDSNQVKTLINYTKKVNCKTSVLRMPSGTIFFHPRIFFCIMDGKTNISPPNFLKWQSKFFWGKVLQHADCMPWSYRTLRN